MPLAVSHDLHRMAMYMQALSTVQQADKIHRWAGMDDAKMEAATRGLWPAVLENVQQVRMARQGLAIHKVGVTFLVRQPFSQSHLHANGLYIFTVY